MKPFAFVCAATLAFVLAGCSKPQPPAAPARPVAKTYPSVYANTAASKAVARYEAAVLAASALKPKGQSTSEMLHGAPGADDAKVFTELQGASRELQSVLGQDAGALTAARREVERRVLTTPEQRRGFEMNAMRLRHQPAPAAAAASSGK